MVSIIADGCTIGFIILTMNKKESIIQHAMIAFSEKGYYGMGLSELLQRCDIPKGSFYYYFPNGKKQLLEETLDYCYTDMKNSWHKNLFDKPDITDIFATMIDGLASEVQHHRYFDSLTMTMIAIESVYLDKDIHQKCTELYQDWKHEYTIQFIKRGYTNEQAIVKAQAVFALIHGSMLSSWIKQDNQDLLDAKVALKAIIDS